MLRVPKPKRPTKKQQAAVDAAYEAHKQALAARAARDAVTPLWLTALRGYITAVVDHHLAMQEVGGDGHYTSDRAGEEMCEELWTQVVEALPLEPFVTADDYRALADIVREAQAIGRRDEERRKRLGIDQVSYADEVRPYELSEEAFNLKKPQGHIRPPGPLV